MVITEAMAVCFLAGIFLMALVVVGALLFASRDKSYRSRDIDRQFKANQEFIQNGFYQATGDILRETARSSLNDRINRF